MESDFLIAIGSALWLGILTSISPCPLATNIAAVSYIGKNIKGANKTIWSGIFYSLGRVLAYVILAALILWSFFSIPELGRFFQKYMNLIIGPGLILVGLFLLNVFKVNFSLSGNLSEKMQGKLANSGYFGATALGFIFALTFCPVSAGLYFGSLIPMSMSFNSIFILPTVYGLGTALPVLIFAVMLAFSANKIAKAFDNVNKFQNWAIKITGWVFIAVGLYFVWRHIISPML